MQLYLIRHAHAVAGKDDDARPLSKKGRQQSRAMGAALRRAGLVEAREFWHSPLVRARETAELMASRLKKRIACVEVDGLRHEDDPAIMARRLNARKKPVAVVGHEPHLSALASHLLVGRGRPSRFVLKKGAVLALENVDGRWCVRWQLSPETLER